MRVLLGARVSLIVGLVVVGVSSIVGMAMGAVAGYYGGAVDQMIGRVMDILMAFPGLLLAIALVAVLGPSLVNVVLASPSSGGWLRPAGARPGAARASSSTLPPHALGAGPCACSPGTCCPRRCRLLLVQATLGMAGAILSEAALSFLGLGVQPPTPSWGTMINGGRVHLLDAPHLTVFPGLFLAIVVLGFQLLRRRVARR